MKIKRLLAVFNFALLLCLSQSIFAETTVTTTGVAELKALLVHISSLQGNFQQVIKSEAGRQLQSCTGKMWLKKPGQFRWEILGNEPRLIVADGKKVWDYDKDLEQVTIQKLNKAQTAAPIFFLTGDVNSLDADFKIKKLPLVDGHCLKNSESCFELHPKNSEGSFQWIKIGFKAKTLNEMELLDQLGQVSVFSFKQVQLNANIPDSQFHFMPSKGVDVLTND
ncbi:MAG TPA: outer membrane lipoprotein chaperone LolA [Gammaproteobacteria bacterium]|nr:outer membrane lipoprotein chaperone LolA [Gammaproteobacteria bacterium]